MKMVCNFVLLSFIGAIHTFVCLCDRLQLSRVSSELEFKGIS